MSSLGMWQARLHFPRHRKQLVVLGVSGLKNLRCACSHGGFFLFATTDFHLPDSGGYATTVLFALRSPRGCPGCFSFSIAFMDELGRSLKALCLKICFHDAWTCQRKANNVENSVLLSGRRQFCAKKTLWAATCRASELEPGFARLVARLSRNRDEYSDSECESDSHSYKSGESEC